METQRTLREKIPNERTYVHSAYTVLQDIFDDLKDMCKHFPAFFESF